VGSFGREFLESGLGEARVRTISYAPYCLAVLLVSVPTYAQAFDWEFDDFYTSNLLYLHPVVNYELHPLWYRDWEDNLYSSNSVRFSFGSVTLTELFSDSRIVINEHLIHGLWFRLDDTWYASHHVDREERTRRVGLEQYLWEGFSTFCYGDLAFNKEEADILFGISVTDSTRRLFARVAFLDEDQFYDEKNDMAGKTQRRPLGLTWALNHRIGLLRVFSEGRCSSGFHRTFADSALSLGLSSHSLKDNRALIKLYYCPNEASLWEFAVARSFFSESKEYHDSAFDYDYTNRVTSYNLRCLFRIREQKRLRIGSYYIKQIAEASKYEEYSYRRNEVLPYLFLEIERPFGTVELCYLGSYSTCTYHAAEDADDYDTDSYVDKIKLGYSYGFSEKAKIQLSVSHVLAIEEFGGGNAQFLLFF
jgi:hypothetical protein